MTRYEKHCEILYWTAKQYSKDTIEQLVDLIHLLRPTEKIIGTIYEIIKQKPSEQEFLDKLREEFPEYKEINN